jgi:hypothetical protein
MTTEPPLHPTVVLVTVEKARQPRSQGTYLLSEDGVLTILFGFRF